MHNASMNRWKSGEDCDLQPLSKLSLGRIRMKFFMIINMLQLTMTTQYIIDKKESFINLSFKSCELANPLLDQAFHKTSMLSNNRLIMPSPALFKQSPVNKCNWISGTKQNFSKINQLSNVKLSIAILLPINILLSPTSYENLHAPKWDTIGKQAWLEYTWQCRGFRDHNIYGRFTVRHSNSTNISLLATNQLL